MGKGDKRRPRLISAEMEDLRWELAFKCKDNPERKKEILARLEQLKKGER
jgi:hypothetical protein